MARSLSQLDPREAWEPAPQKPWDLKWAAHLYRRAAFGVPPAAIDDDTPAWERLQRAPEQGRTEAIEQVLEGEAGQDDFENLLDATGERIAKSSFRRFRGLEPEKLQGWWLYRMRHTPHPLRERCTLFWHDHFATSLAKVGRPELMFQQNVLFRRHALGRFGPLLHAVSRDPAMMIWLDTGSNVKGRPNENFARELLELFALGVGHYTEEDIREAARAFTGWSTAGGEFIFNAHQHDDGRKTVLGETGNLDGDDVVRIVLKQPACPRFLAGKLFREFVSDSEAPPAKLLEPLAEQLRKSDYDIKAAIAMILRSKLFFSEHARRRRIKSPVEYVIGSVSLFDGRGPMEQLAAATEGMGQKLFYPPDVSGWDAGTAWLNTATLVARHNLASQLVHGKLFRSGSAVSPDELVRRYARSHEPDAQVAFLLQLLLQDGVSHKVHVRLASHVTAEDPSSDLRTEQLRSVAHAVMTLPEYQLA